MAFNYLIFIHTREYITKYVPNNHPSGRPIQIDGVEGKQKDKLISRLGSSGSIYIMYNHEFISTKPKLARPCLLVEQGNSRANCKVKDCGQALTGCEVSMLDSVYNVQLFTHLRPDAITNTLVSIHGAHPYRTMCCSKDQMQAIYQLLRCTLM